MKLTVNQQSIETEAKNLEELVAELNLPNQGVAVAVDNRLVKRNEWADYALTDDAKSPLSKLPAEGKQLFVFFLCSFLK